MFGGGNMQGMLKKVQKMQKDMEKAQEEIKNTVVEASIGGGAVSVTMNGEQEVLSIKIAPAAVDPEDVESKRSGREKIRGCHRKLETSWNARYVLI